MLVDVWWIWCSLQEKRSQFSRNLYGSYCFSRSSCPGVVCKKGVLRNFAKFTGKHMCQSLKPANLLKKRLWHRCFPVNFANFLRTPYLIEHLRWQLLFFPVFLKFLKELFKSKSCVTLMIFYLLFCGDIERVLVLNITE